MFNQDRHHQLKGTAVAEENAATLHEATNKNYEISLKYLHSKWAELDKLKEIALKKLSKHILKIQKGSINNNNIKRMSPNQIQSHKKLGKIYPKNIKFGETLKIIIDRKARIFMAFEDKEGSNKIYLLIVDPNHKIDP